MSEVNGRRALGIVSLGVVAMFGGAAPTQSSWSVSGSPSLVRQVAKTGSDSGDCTATPCRTIGYAIGQSLSGDTIEVANLLREVLPREQEMVDQTHVVPNRARNPSLETFLR